MSDPREELELHPYASHSSIFLSDEEETTHAAYGAWHDTETNLRRVLVSPFELQVTTARYDVVPLTVRLWDSAPSAIPGATHVVEADLQVPSGVLVIHCVVDDFKTAPRLRVEPGRLRMRISYMPRTKPEPGSNLDEPGDHYDYVADCWPSDTAREPATLVQGDEIWAM